MKKFVFSFKSKDAKKLKIQKNILGGKGANLAEMTNMAIPVPPGFTISTDVCTHYMDTGIYPKMLESEAEKALEKIETIQNQQEI